MGMVAVRSTATGAAGAAWSAARSAGAITLLLGLAVTIALPTLRQEPLVAIFALGEVLFGVGLMLAVVGIGIDLWTRPAALQTPRREWLRQAAGAAARSDLVLCGLAVNWAGAALHPVALLLMAPTVTHAGTGAVAFATLVAVFLTRLPVLVFMLRRRHVTEC
jgi:hypothetical protein